MVRVGGIQEKGTLKTTVRDVFFVWIGPNVSIIDKGKKSANLGDAKSLLQVCPFPLHHPFSFSIFFLYFFFFYLLSYFYLFYIIFILSFQPFHADITVTNRKKFNREEILDKSAPLSGSHVIS